MSEESNRFICPMPDAWAAVHQRLLEAWKRAGDRAMPEPPRPLILGGWAFSSDTEKRERWAETVRWAMRHGFRRLIPDIAERDAYRGSASNMITKQQAEQIASVAINRIPALSGARVRTVVAWSEIPWRRPYIYNAPPTIEQSLVAYLEFPDEPLMLRSFESDCHFADRWIGPIRGRRV